MKEGRMKEDMRERMYDFICKQRNGNEIIFSSINSAKNKRNI